MNEAYQNLEATFARVAALNGASAVLGWDMQAMMPPGGVTARGEQLAVLEELSHGMLTKPEVGAWLSEVDTSTLSAWQVANLREMRRTYIHATAVDADLTGRLSRAGTTCTNIWRVARKANDFESFRPALEEVVALVREVAARKADVLQCTPYDALLDQFEPGITSERIDELFAPLARELPGRVERILERQARGEAALPLDGPFPRDAQERLGRTLMEAFGFRFTHGRLDTSDHPFCGGTPSDIRVTTRYDESDFASALMGVLHETGHALYEQQLPVAWRSQPVGRARSMGVHESQSLFVEMQVCRSAAFLRFAAPRIRDAFGVDGPAWSPENLTRHAQRVERGLIRVDADEVTYPMHVMLRFELEKRLIGGELSVSELPDAWAEGMQRWLGVTVPDDATGCMQDIHWTDGAFGYFPSYTLGAMAAAQLHEAVRRDRPELESEVESGVLSPLISWLGERVHALASSVDTDVLIREATGSVLGADAFLRHVDHRYLE